MSEKDIGNQPDFNTIYQASSLPEDEVRLLLERMWAERRGRPHLTEKPNNSLTIALGKPIYDVREVLDPMLDLLAETPPEIAYDWSEHWGRARISLSPSGLNTIRFLNTATVDAKKYHPIITSRKEVPSELMFDSSPKDSGYTIMINNDQPVTIEAAVLQVERMTDELIWSLTKEYEKEQDMPKMLAYSTAVERVASSGLNVRYASLDDILRLKQAHSQAVGRMYGNIHNKQVIPPVIGIVLPPEIDATGSITETRTVLHEATHNKALEINPSHESDKYRPVALESFTLGKRLHAGHLFHLSRIESSCSSFANEADIHIEFNDTGSRFSALLKTGAAETGLPVNQLADAISSGKIDLATVERWYQNRVDDNPSPLSQEMSLNSRLNMSFQAEEVMNTLRKVLPNRQLSYNLSSNLDHEAILNISDPEWRHSGFELYNRRILRKEAEPTPLLTRASFALNALRKHGLGRPYVYIDSNSEVNEATNIVSNIVNQEFLVQQGAAVGFNFEIASGTKGNSEPIEAILEWYVDNISTDAALLIKDVAYITGTRPIALPLDRRNAFYNYKDIQSLKDDIMRAHNERLQLFETRKNIDQVLPASHTTTIRAGLSKASAREINKILTSKLSQMPKLLTDGGSRIIERVIQEDNQPHHIHSHSKWNQTIHSLQHDLKQLTENKSQILRTLEFQVYTELNEQLKALELLQETNTQLRFHYTPQQLVLKNIQTILNGVVSLDPASRQQFVNVYDMLLRQL